MTKLLITGGQQREKRGIASGNKRWYRYGEAHMVRVDPTTGSMDTVLSYTTPSHLAAAEDPAILFKQGHRSGDVLFLTTQTEVLIYSYPGLELQSRITLPSFNDVHHVRPMADGTLLVVSTGLDQLMRLDQGGDVIDRWSVCSDDPWGSRFDPAEDYRLHASTKPYEAHPNHVFLIDDEPFVTRFELRDAVSIRDRSRRIDIGVERVHDGLVVDDMVYFTTVDGRVAIASTDTLEVVEIVDLRTLDEQEVLLGWCRGILVEGDEAWVGFSRLRPTAFRQNVAWVREGFRRSLGTHIARYDLKRQTLLERVELEDRTPLNAVFSILAAD